MNSYEVACFDLTGALVVDYVNLHADDYDIDGFNNLHFIVRKHEQGSRDIVVATYRGGHWGRVRKTD